MEAWRALSLSLSLSLLLAGRLGTGGPRYPAHSRYAVVRVLVLSLSLSLPLSFSLSLARSIRVWQTFEHRGATLLAGLRCSGRPPTTAIMSSDGRVSGMDVFAISIWMKLAAPTSWMKLYTGLPPGVDSCSFPGGRPREFFSLFVLRHPVLEMNNFF